MPNDPKADSLWDLGCANPQIWTLGCVSWSPVSTNTPGATARVQLVASVGCLAASRDSARLVPSNTA